MVAIDLAYAANTLQRRLIANVAADGIARIGGVYHYAASIDDLRRTPQQPQLRMGGMDFKVLAHKPQQVNVPRHAGKPRLDLKDLNLPRWRLNLMITTPKRGHRESL
jgi:hypothetical protein